MNKQQSSRKPGLNLLLLAILINFGGSFHYGLQITLINPSKDVFLKFLNSSIVSHYQMEFNKNELETLWGIIVAILFVGAIFGSLTLNKIADKFGRKRGLIFANSINLFSLLMAIMAKFILSFELYAFSRILIGFSLALSLGLSIIFITESSPKHCRGSVGMTTGIMLQMGMLTGSLLGMREIFGTLNRWWLIYGVEVVIYIIVLLILLFVYETPGYLLMHNKDDEARKAIQFYYACSKNDVDDHLNVIKENIKLNTKSYGILEIWRPTFTNGTDRRGLLIGCVIMFAISFSGNSVIGAFAVDIFQSAKFSHLIASLANVGLSIISISCSIISSCFIDCYGRRPLLLIAFPILLSLNILLFSFQLISEIYAPNWIGICIITTISLFIFVFASGPSPVSLFLSSEMVSQNARSAVQSWSSLVLMIGRTIVLSSFLPLKNLFGISWAYLILFVGPILFSIIFLYFCLPETKNRNLKEVEEEFKNLPKINIKCFTKSSTFK